MQTTIKQVSPVEYELEVTALAEDLAPEFNKALREQRARTALKGFRPGKVPLPLVKKMYGKALAYALADKSVQETYEEVVLNASDHDVLGQPKITALEYEMDGDLRAVIQFGVRPEITLQDLSGETVSALVHHVTDEEVEAQVQRMLDEKADLIPVEDGAIEDGDFVVFDMQELDAATRTPLIGRRDEGRQVFLDDSLDGSPLLSALREKLRGAKGGDIVRFSFEHDKAHDLHVVGESHAHFFEATVKEVKRRDVPELDDDLVKEISNDEIETVAALREEIKQRLADSWEQRARDLLESNIIERMLALHPVPVPASVVDLYIESYIEDIKQRNEGKLPAGFSEEKFSASNRSEAEKQARWMLIRDKFIEAERLDVTNDDLDQFFAREAEKDGNLEAAQLRQFYEAVRLMDSLEQRLLSRKVFDRLAERFEVVERDAETLEVEAAQRRVEALAASEAPAPETRASEAAVAAETSSEEA